AACDADYGKGAQAANMVIVAGFAEFPATLKPDQQTNPKSHEQVSEVKKRCGSVHGVQPLLWVGFGLSDGSGALMRSERPEKQCDPIIEAVYFTECWRAPARFLQPVAPGSGCQTDSRWWRSDVFSASDGRHPRWRY